MKTLRSSLVLLALRAPAQFHPYVDANSFGSLLDRPAFYDGLMVATALGPPVGHPLPGHPNFASQPFRVEDSRAFAPGTLVDVFYEMGGPSGAASVEGLLAPTPPNPGAPLSLPGVPAAGARALVVGRLPRDGALRLPGGNIDERGDRAVPLGDASRPSVLQVTQFATTQTRLYADPEPRWRLLGSLAAAIPGTGDANARAIAQSISIKRDRDPRLLTYGGPDDRFSLLFAGAVAKDTAYHRALVDYGLNELQYLGYAARYRRDVLQAAEEPDAFPEGPREYLEFREDPVYRALWPKGYQSAPSPTEADELAALRQAKSPTVAAYLLDGLKKPSDEDIRSFARFLDSPDPQLRWAFAERLATWYGYAPPAKPVETYDPVAKERQYASNPELDATVAMWKGKLAAGTLP